MKEVKKIECPKCGFSNVYGISKCIKCNTLLKSYLVCPRCAKKNELETKKCVNCGYKFGRKKTSILFNLIIAVVLVGLLFVISKVSPDTFGGTLKNMKRVTVVVILLILLATLTYGKKEINHYSAEEQIIENSKVIKVKKITSILIGVILAGIFIFICFKYLIK